MNILPRKVTIEFSTEEIEALRDCLILTEIALDVKGVTYEEAVDMYPLGSRDRFAMWEIMDKFLKATKKP